MSARSSLQAIFDRLIFDVDIRQKTWRKLSAQLRHDVNLEYALKVMRDRHKERKQTRLAHIFDQIIKGIRYGESFDVALHGLVPPEELLLLRGGHVSGRLSESLELTAKLIDAQKAIKKAVVGAVVYPFVLIAMLIAVLVVLSVQVVPALSQLADPSSFTGAASLLFSVASVVASPLGVALLVGFFGLIATIFITLPFWTGKSRLMVEHLPPWSIYRLVVGTMWLFTIATSLRADIPIMQVLDDMLKCNPRPWLKERIEAIYEQYNLGKKFGNVLADSGLRFPDPAIVDDILVYSSLPEFETLLRSLAQEWLEGGIARIKEQSTILNAVLLMCIIGTMCLLGVAIISIQQQLSANLGAI